MATLYQVRTFEDIVAAIREEMQISSSDTNAINRIKRDVNATYEEVAAEKNWWWLQGHITLQMPGYLNTGTVEVSAGSSTITFSTAPGPSLAGYWFATDSYQEIYRIESHVAGATAAKLDTLFSGTSDSDATFKCWKDRLPLPTDCKETLDIYHEHHALNLEPKGLQEFRRIVAMNPRAEGKPRWYYTGDFVDPAPTSSITSLPAVSTRSSAGVRKTLVFASGLPSALITRVSDGEPVKIRVSGAGTPSYNGDVLIGAISTTSTANDTITYSGKGDLQESSTSDSSISVTYLDQETSYDRHRELFIYPSLNSTRVTMHVDYSKQIQPLKEDDDEPAMPKEDRMVLVYGALHRAWSRGRQPEEAARNWQLYQNKVAKMAGKLQDSQEQPRLAPSKLYLSGKRNTPRSRSLDGFGPSGATLGSSAAIVTGTPNTIAIFNSSGDIQGSSTVSTTEAGYLDGVASQLAGINDTATFTNKSIDADANTITNIDNNDIKAAAGIAVDKLAALTASRAVVSDSSGFLASSAITATEVTYLDDNEPLTSVTLTDNTAAAANVATWTAASFDSIFIDYTIKRSTTIFEAGQINIVTDGTNAAISQTGAGIGSTGVTFTVDVSGGSLRLRYTTTSTGANATFKYKVQKWLS